MKSRKQIRPSTVAGDKEAAADGGVGCDLFIHKIGGGSLVSREVKQHGRKPSKIWFCPDEPSSDSDISDIDKDDTLRDYDFRKLLDGYHYSNKPKAEREACLEAYLAIPQEELSPEEMEPCDRCLGKWHQPSTIEPPCVPPLPGPGWFVACRCCSEMVEDNTKECARCGSRIKCVLRKTCSVCLDVGHFKSDKECPFYGKAIPRYNPLGALLSSGPGIKKCRQPSRKKLAKKKKEVAVVPSDDAGAGAVSAAHDLA